MSIQFTTQPLKWTPLNSQQRRKRRYCDSFKESIVTGSVGGSHRVKYTTGQLSVQKHVLKAVDVASVQQLWLRDWSSAHDMAQELEQKRALQQSNTMYTGPADILKLNYRNRGDQASCQSATSKTSPYSLRSCLLGLCLSCILLCFAAIALMLICEDL